MGRVLIVYSARTTKSLAVTTDHDWKDATGSEGKPLGKTNLTHALDKPFNTIGLSCSDVPHNLMFQRFQQELAICRVHHVCAVAAAILPWRHFRALGGSDSYPSVLTQSLHHRYYHNPEPKNRDCNSLVEQTETFRPAVHGSGHDLPPYRDLRSGKDMEWPTFCHEDPRMSLFGIHEETA
jgi:hypothetical protein